MCGIAGRFHPTQLPEDPAWHERAAGLLAHRGPDGKGRHVDRICELIHTRLAIIDLTPSGDQPMPNEDGSVQVVFNGEIYNHLDLRRDLQGRGHRFRGTSDTEVLAHLYEEHGSGLAERLRGMFAFAVYDRNRRLLLLARDRYGIKPLYYAATRDQVVFASEIKAILAVSGFPRMIDRQACYDYLGRAYVPEPASGFAGLSMLPKGSTLEFDARGSKARTYHAVRADPQESLSMDDAVHETEAALLSAAGSQSRADVPVAALLSGGIDSSLVVAALCRSTTEPPVTFNVRFPDAEYDETDMALAVARRYGTRHRTIDIGRDMLAADSAASLLRHFDQPFADSSLFPTYAVSRAIRDNGIICTVSGDGGDEAYGGYASFWRLNVFRRLMLLPDPLRTLLQGLGRAVTPLTTDVGRRIAKAARLAGIGREATARLFAAFYNYLDEDEKEAIVLPAARAGLLPSSRNFGPYEPAGVTDLDALSRRLTDGMFAESLPADMLRKVDMMSMRASIEVRVPMLDDQVVGCGLRLPHRLKTDGRNGKLVLRRLAQRWLPHEVAVHRKQGFAIPLDRMVGGDFHAMLSDLLLADGSRVRRFLDVGIVAYWLRLFREARNGRRPGALSRAGLYQRVLILLALEVWLREQRLEW